MAPAARHIADMSLCRRVVAAPAPGGFVRLARASAIGSAAVALAACAGPAVRDTAPGPPAANGPYAMDRLADGSVRVYRTAGAPFTYSDGLPARQAADALCGPRGVDSSDRDRFEGGAWVFVEGCA